MSSISSVIKDRHFYRRTTNKMKTYILNTSPHALSIQCQICYLTSHSCRDIENRWCAFCNFYHYDMEAYVKENGVGVLYSAREFAKVKLAMLEKRNKVLKKRL